MMERHTTRGGTTQHCASPGSAGIIAAMCCLAAPPGDRVQMLAGFRAGDSGRGARGLGTRGRRTELAEEAAIATASASLFAKGISALGLFQNL